MLGVRSVVHGRLQVSHVCKLSRGTMFLGALCVSRHRGKMGKYVRSNTRRAVRLWASYELCGNVSTTLVGKTCGGGGNGNVPCCKLGEREKAYGVMQTHSGSVGEAAFPRGMLSFAFYFVSCSSSTSLCKGHFAF